MSQLLSEQMVRYLDNHVSDEGPELRLVERMTHLRTLQPRMMSGRQQGMFLRILCRLMRPRTILEIGSFTGYSALSMAIGSSEDCQIHSIEVNAELKVFHEEFIRPSSVGKKIQFHYGDAGDIIPTLSIRPDLVFIDADKKRNVFYLDLLHDRLDSGAIVLIDNVLWSGKVADLAYQDKDTLEFRALNDRNHLDDRYESMVLSIRDGIAILQKK